jgi:hypothetical protein
MERAEAQRELAFLRELFERTRRRLDPHAFHFVHWGAIVLVWYPIGAWLQQQGRVDDQLPLGAAALGLGFLLSLVRESRLARSPRVEGENTFVGRQVAWITAACIAAGAVLSALAPAFGFVEGENMPIVWGLVYANLAVMVGIVYERDFLLAGLVIFAGAIVAICLQPWAGYVLGPTMGRGMIVPGRRAEKRVRALRDA